MVTVLVVGGICEGSIIHGGGIMGARSIGVGDGIVG